MGSQRSVIAGRTYTDLLVECPEFPYDEEAQSYPTIADLGAVLGRSRPHRRFISCPATSSRRRPTLALLQVIHS